MFKKFLLSVALVFATAMPAMCEWVEVCSIGDIKFSIESDSVRRVDKDTFRVWEKTFGGDRDSKELIEYRTTDDSYVSIYFIGKHQAGSDAIPSRHYILPGSVVDILYKYTKHTLYIREQSRARKRK